MGVIMHDKRRKGYTLLETIACIFCVSVVIIAILSVTSVLTSVSLKAKQNTITENYAVCVMETISSDLRSGREITEIDYNEDERINNISINSSISIQKYDDVYGKALYYVEIVVRNDLSEHRQVLKAFLREGI